VTPSDTGPWLLIHVDGEADSHVLPDFGPKHELSTSCWCHPERNPHCPQTIVHNVPH